MNLVKLDWITWQPTPYNDFLFRTLAADEELALTVHFVAPILPTHPWKSEMAKGFSSRVFHQRAGLDLRSLQLAVRDKNRFFIVAGWHQSATFSLLNTLMLLGRKFAIWTDTPDCSKPRGFPKAVLRTRWLRTLFHRASYVMGTGTPALSALEAMGCPPEKLVTFPFVLDLELFKPLESQGIGTGDGQPLVFLSSGRLSNVLKGYDLAIKALASIHQRTGLDFRYRIAGEGPDKEALRELARTCGLESQVDFIGWLEPSELPGFYRSGDIFLHPSHFDPFPNAVLEAMASGLPVIGSDLAGSVVDRIKHGENGLIHRANDIDDLTDQIFRAVKDRTAAVEMGRKARVTAETWPVERAVATVKQVVLGTSSAVS